MSFKIPFSRVTAKIKKEIGTKCSIKPSTSQYIENPVNINVFRVCKETNNLIIPLSLWPNYSKTFPNDYSNTASFIPKIDLFTKETDPKGYRDQDVVFNEAWNNLKTDGHTFLELNTGFGKTCLGTMLAAKTGCKTLVICHLDKVNTQWKESFERFTTAKVQILKTNKIDETADVYICGIKKAYNMRDQLGFVKTVLFDEAHIATTSAATGILLHIYPRFLVGLTATLKRVDGLHSLLELYFGPMNNYIKRNEVKPFTVIKYNTGFKPIVNYRQVFGKVTLDWVGVKNSLSYNKDRQKLICDLVLKYKDRKIMVLVDRIELCKNLISDLKDIESVTGLYGSIKKHNSDARVLIASSSKAGVGFDQPGLDMLIIASDVKNVTQWEGRIRCDDNIIIDLVDDLSTLENHWKLREKWYRKRGATIIVEGKRMLEEPVVQRMLN